MNQHFQYFRKICYLLLLSHFSGILSGQTTVTYKETQEIFANPERGLQKYSITNESYNTSGNFSNLNQTTLTGWRTGPDRVTVIFRYFLLSAYLNSDISSNYLNNIQKDFDIIRFSGLKCIVRFSYSNSQSSSAQQPAKAQILKHITQIATLLTKNQDIIFSHQAGFLGTWGEWYYINSTEFGTEGEISAAQWANRKDIIEAMLAATPQSIPLQVRYPEIKQTMYGMGTLTEETAYRNTANARIGFFNDAFLNKWGDMGTYNVASQNVNPVGTADYLYLSNETQFTPMTGETNGLNAPRTGGDNAVIEMNATNWTTLNRDYYTQNFNNWISSGHYPEIVKRLGYRFELERCVFTLSDNQLQMNLSLKNTGFARMFKSRKALLVLKNGESGQVYSFELKTDPRTWNALLEINQTMELTPLPSGTYSCHLSLPDADENLSKRPEYSIRFANEQVWNEADGTNNLNFSFNYPIVSGINNPEYLTTSRHQSIKHFHAPNSGKEIVHLNTTVAFPAEMTITDLQGRIIIKNDVESHAQMYNELNTVLSTLETGYYLISFKPTSCT